MKSQDESRISAKRETILDAATSAFRDDGYECASMDQIAELAGASKRTVYNHFGSKDALFQAVVARLFEQSMAMSRVGWDPERPLEEQLARFIRAKARLSEDQASRCLTRVVLGVYIRQPELLREAVSRVAEDEGPLVDWLRRADRAGRLRVPNPELAAHVFAKMSAGVLFWPQLLQGPMDPETRELLTREVVETFLARYRVESR